MRGGNTGPARGIVPFVKEALALLPEGTWLRTIRAESGFFDGAFPDIIESRVLCHVAVARLNSTLKKKGAGLQPRTPMNEHHHAGGFSSNNSAGSRNAALYGRANACGHAKRRWADGCWTPYTPNAQKRRLDCSNRLPEFILIAALSAEILLGIRRTDDVR